VQSIAIAIGMSTVFVLTTDDPTAAPQTQAPVSPAPEISAQLQAQCLRGGELPAIRHLRTGAVRFVGTEPGLPIPNPALPPNASPEDAARAYLESCGELFGVARQA